MGFFGLTFGILEGTRLSRRNRILSYISEHNKRNLALNYRDESSSMHNKLSIDRRVAVYEVEK